MKELLKKLKYYNYFYKIKININDLPKDINLINLKTIDNYLIASTNKKNIKYLNDLNIQYELIRYNNFLKNFFIRKWIGVVTLTIIFILMIFSNNFIRKIYFKNNYVYDENVLVFVKENLNKVGNIYLLKDNLDVLNNKIKIKFNYYEFINVYKQNGNLIINIVKNDNTIIEKPITSNKMISSKNSYILKIEISNGKKEVELFQMIKKGDLLITGDKPKGNIVGRCIEVYNYKIPKTYYKEVYTNNYFKNRYIKYKDTRKDIISPYEMYYKTENIIYKLGNFSLVEEVYFEKEEVKIEYTIESIDDYLVDYIKYLFYRQHTYKDEKILDIKIVNKSEDDEYLYIKTINTTIEQIAIYKE